MQPLSKGLVRRIEALESTARKSTPRTCSPLLDLAIKAMAWAWTPDEVEEMLIAAEESRLHEIPADLQNRWVRHLDRISLDRFGKTYGELMASPPADTGAAPTGSNLDRPDIH